MSPGGAVPTGVGATGGTGDVGSVGGPSVRGRSVASRLAVGVLLGAVLAVCLIALAGVGGATVPGGTFEEENDTSSPTVGNLTKVDDVTVQLVIEDDVGVDEDTIDAGDFLTDVGRISTVNASENGTDAHVQIELSSELNTDELTVYVSDDTSIYDDAGNQIHAPGDASRTVGNMDGVAPFLATLDVAEGGNGTIDVRLRFDDPVETLQVDVEGPETEELDLGDFAAGSDRYEYVTTIDPGADGEYEIEVDTVTDSYGNAGYPRRSVAVTVDETAPEAVAFVDLQASTGRNFTFDAGRSRDAIAIDNVTWDMGDGSTERGERVSHRFEPGNYTVTLYVTDDNGNTGTDEVFVVASGRNGSLGPGATGSTGATVRMTGGGDAPAAMVDVAGATAGSPVRIPARAGRTVASTDAVVLRNMSLTPATNASYRLGVQADGPAAVRDVESAADVTALGGLTVVHEIADADLERVTFTLAVDRGAIDEAGGEPGDVRLYRRGDGGWQGLETAIVERSNDTVRYRATSPGLSRFAVVVGPDGGQPTPEDGSPSTDRPTASGGPPDGPSDDGEGSPLFELSGVLAVLPLGLLEAVVTYVGGVVVAVFLLLKALALSMGY